MNSNAIDLFQTYFFPGREIHSAELIKKNERKKKLFFSTKAPSATLNPVLCVFEN